MTYSEAGEKVYLREKATGLYGIAIRKKVYLRESIQPKEWCFLPEGGGDIGRLVAPSGDKFLRVNWRGVVRLSRFAPNKEHSEFIFERVWSVQRGAHIIKQNKSYLAEGSNGRVVLTGQASKATAWKLD